MSTDEVELAVNNLVESIEKDLILHKRRIKIITKQISKDQSEGRVPLLAGILHELEQATKHTLRTLEKNIMYLDHISEKIKEQENE